MTFTKVKGHATWGDVRQGRVTRQDKVGNCMADFLAVQGAALHPSALPLATDQEARVSFAKDLQRMYLNILKGQSADTKDIEDAMPPVIGRFGRGQQDRRRRMSRVDVSSSGPGPKRRRVLAPAPGHPAAS